MKYFIWGLIIFVIIALFSWFTHHAAPKQDKVINYLKGAVEYAKTHGRAETIAEFQKENGAFHKTDQYLFMYNNKGIILADVSNPQAVGSNRLDITDILGQHFVKEMVATAETGGGWVTYYWRNPTDNRIEKKMTYVMPIDEYTFVASGYYPDGY